MAKKIVIHSLVFSPDKVSTAYLYNDIAIAFKEAGYDVIVVTTTPHYSSQGQLNGSFDKKYFGLYYISDFNGIKVYHVFQKKYRSSFLRMLSFIRWHLLSFFLILKQHDIQVILSPSPPLTIGVINIWLGALKRAKTIYNVQEIYPDLLIRQKNIRNKFIIKLLRYMEKFVYDKSSACTTIDHVFYDSISPRFEDPSKLHIIPNFVDTELYRPVGGKICLDKHLFPKNNALKLMYAGNIGHAQDWRTFLDVARALRNHNVEFYIIGNGAIKKRLASIVQEEELHNVSILPYQPRDKMSELVSYADLHFIFMTPETDMDGFPSKVYTIMACQKPLLVCSGKNTPIVNFLSDKNCAYLVTEKNYQNKVHELVDIINTVKRDDLNNKGMNGYNCILSHYSKPVVTSQYIYLVNSL